MTVGIVFLFGLCSGFSEISTYGFPEILSFVLLGGDDGVAKDAHEFVISRPNVKYA